MGFAAAIARTVTGDDRAPHWQSDVVRVVWSTRLGLALAHWFVVTLSARIVDDPDSPHTPRQTLTAQLVMASALTLVVSPVVVVLGPDAERLGARLAAPRRSPPSSATSGGPGNGHTARPPAPVRRRPPSAAGSLSPSG